MGFLLVTSVRGFVEGSPGPGVPVDDERMTAG
jgi:hypothetical protein